MAHTSTHTYAVLQISPAAYREIRTALAMAGYEDQFHDHRDGEIIDMHGIALQIKPSSCPICGEEATFQDAIGTLWDSNAHHWRDA